MRSIRTACRGRSGLTSVLLCMVLGALCSPPSLASNHAVARATVHRADRISIDGAVEHARSLTLAALKRAPATTETVSLTTGKGVLTGSYTGVLLWTLLQQAVIRSTPGIKNDILRRTVVVTGSDGYQTVLSVGEIDPKFGGDRALIAYARGGKALSHDRGFARLIVPTDKSAGRAVFGIASITVR